MAPKKKAPVLTVPVDEDRELNDAANRLEELAKGYMPGEQPLDAEEKYLLAKIYERLDIFEQMNRPYHDQAKKCRQILHMRDPDQDTIKTKAKNKKETLQLQTLKSTINNVVADQMLSMPEAKLMPETAKMQDAADDLQDMLHYVFYCANDYEQTHYRRCEDFYTPGTAVTQMAWDEDMAYGKGEIAVIRWPIEAFLWDPLAERLEDCRAVMKVSWHPMSFYREHWPKEGRYVGSERGSHNNVGMTTGQENADHSSDEDRALLIEYWWREYNAETRKYTINVAYAAGNALLEVQKAVYNHGMYPFVVDVHDSIEGTMVGDGLVRELAPMMRYINRYAAYADMNARMSSKGRMIVRRGAGIDKDALANWETDIIEGDQITQGEAWNWMQNQPFNNTITNLMTMFQSDLKADSGANQFTRGETTGGIVSGKAINSLIQAGGKVSSMRTEQLKYGFKQMVEQALWLMSQFYNNDRVAMLTGKDGKQRELKVDMEKWFGITDDTDAVNPPPYSVQIEVSSRDPQRIANQNQMFMEAYSMAAQTPYPIKLSSLLKMCNLDGKDRIVPLIEADEKYGQQMQAMQQQIEQMQAQMEQMQTENDNLKAVNAEAANSIANMSAAKQPRTETAPIAGENQPNPIVDNAANMMGVPTGSSLPT